MHRRHLESVSAALYGRCFCIVRIQPQLSGKGVLGHSPKRILVPFVRIKGTPRRRAAQTLHPAKSTRRRQATTNLAPAGQAYSLCLCKRLRAADRRDEMIALIFAVNPSVSLAADSLSLRLGHGAADSFYSSAGVSVTFSSLASCGSAVSSPSASSASSSRGARASATTRLPSSRRIAWTPPP